MTLHSYAWLFFHFYAIASMTSDIFRAANAKRPCVFMSMRIPFGSTFLSIKFVLAKEKFRKL